MLNVEQIAEICHEANRAYCKVIGDDTTSGPWDDEPQWQRDSVIEGVEKIVAVRSMREIPSPEVSHQGWMTTKLKDGWRYGPKKDEKKKEHPCLLPYRELPYTQTVKDMLFIGITWNLTENDRRHEAELQAVRNKAIKRAGQGDETAKEDKACYNDNPVVKKEIDDKDMATPCPAGDQNDNPVE